MTRRLRALWSAVVVTSLWAMTGCAAVDHLAAPGDALSAAAVRLGMAPRLVLVWLDVSASVPAASIRRDLARLATELGPGDRIIVAAMSDRTHDFAPVLDTLLPGGHLARIGSALGLSTARSRIAAQHELAARSRLLEGAWAAARARHGRTSTSLLLDAVCHSAELAETHPRHRVVALLLTDGIVEQAGVDLSGHVPSPAHARRTGSALAERARCDLRRPTIAVRLTGVAHPHATVALRAWWRTLLETLGARVAADDVASHRSRPLLAMRGRA